MGLVFGANASLIILAAFAMILGILEKDVPGTNLEVLRSKFPPFQSLQSVNKDLPKDTDKTGKQKTTHNLL